MKKYLLSLLGMWIVLPAIARDFEYTYEGQTLTYTVLDEAAKTVETKAGGKYFDPGNDVSGDLVIPDIVKDGTTVYSVISIGDLSFSLCSGLTSVNIPNSVTSIGESAFRSCRALNSVNVPNSVTTIGRVAFSGCEGLKSVTIGGSVTSIGEDAFSFCDELTSVTIGNSVREIGKDAFCWCRSLTSITIPGSVVSIGVDAFYNCDNLVKVEFASIESLCSITFSDYDSNPLCNGGELYIKGQKITDLVIPDNIASIGDYSFTGCSSLTSIIIPTSVTSIGVWTFSGCSNLTSVTIPNSITSLEYGVFSECSSLGSINIPESVIEIEDFAFRGCSSLVTINLPRSITSINSYTFSECNSLKTVVIPNSITEIGFYVFSYCDSLTSIYYGAEDPIVGDSQIFEDRTYADATLYLPEGVIAKAKEIDPWKNFANIQAYDFSGVEEISADINPNLPYDVYDLNGVKVGNSADDITAGVYILRQGKSVRKITVK